jgi:hypothetical protein
MADEKKDDIEVTDAPEKAEILTASEGIEDLKRQLAAEKSRAAEAERRANAAAQTAHAATVDQADTNLKLLETAIETSKNNSAALRAAYADAARANDFDKIAEIQEKMTANQLRLQQLEAGAEQMRNAPKAKPPAPIVVDPVEAMAVQLTPRSAAWIRAHPEYARDQRLFNKMVAAHNLVIADEIPVDSDEYFSSVEKALGFDRRQEPETEPEESPFSDASAPTRKTTPVAAPSGRGSSAGRSGASSNNGRSVRLTEAEREIARMNQMTDEQYAQAKVALKREGRLN